MQNQEPNSYQMIPNPTFWLRVTEQKTSLPLTLRLQLLNIKKVGRWAIVSTDFGQETERIWVTMPRVHWASVCARPLAECWMHSLISFSHVVRYKCDQHCAFTCYSSRNWGSRMLNNLPRSTVLEGASQGAQMVRYLPSMWETWVQSLDWDDPLEKIMATHSSILAWRIPMDRGAWWATVHGVAKSQTQLSDQNTHTHTHTHTHTPLESKRARLSTQVSDSESLPKTSHMLPTSSATWLT